MIREKLSAIQTSIKAPKNLYNSFGKYNYRNAESICEAVKPYLESQKCALTLNDEIIEVGGRVYVKAIATLMDNETEETIVVSAFARESADKKGMDDSQITGATSSYARKYALNGLFLLDDTKDADTDEYHNTVNNSKAKTNANKVEATINETLPKTEEEAKALCSEKQVGLIKSLIAQVGGNEADFLNKFDGNRKSFAELTKAEAKTLIDYLMRGK